MMKRTLVVSSAFVVLLLCSCHDSKTAPTQSSDAQTEMQDTQSAMRDADSVASAKETDEACVSAGKITAESAYEGVSNYCHRKYDWSIAEGNPSIMYVEMGEETESEYQVIFRSYTGAFVYFYVDKTSGMTRMVERVPSLNVENEVGTINLSDYLEKKN
ncbi:MAG: hypothetical protein K6C10_03050 [Prevotella sp.]|nr:hypothetical protein [Prevotella sp.]